MLSSQNSPRKMEEKRKDAGNLHAASTPVETPKKVSDTPPAEQPSSRRRGGAQKRKHQSLSSLSGQQNSSSKRQAREKVPAVPFPQIHNGPLTRGRLQPASVFGAQENSVKSELDAAAGTLDSRAKKVEEELAAAREDYEALESKIEAEYEKIRSRDVNAHVVPVHCGWFSWTKVHPLEEQSLPSFFSGKSENRTPALYMEIRNWIVNKFHTNPNTTIELKDLSEISLGEEDMKQEIMEFLDYWGLINYHPFPDTESLILKKDADVSEKQESLLEKLYQFDNEQSFPLVIPKSNVATAAVPSRLVPESTIAEELMTSDGPSVEYHCNSCSADCSRKRYHCQKQADFDLCSECFTSGKFGSDMSSSDFILMEPAEAAGASSGKWTDQETLLLLEAIELFKENWNEIAEHVATKTKAQCILHFVQMPIEDPFMDCDDQTDEILQEIADPSSATEDVHDPKDTNGVAEHKDGDISGPPLSTPIEVSEPVDISKTQAVQGNGENCILKALKEAFEVVGSHSLEEKFSFADAGNPVMALAAFLVRLVEPDIVTASTRTSLKSISDNASGMHLAARHCFLLEDPVHEGKKPADSQRTRTELGDQEGLKDNNQESDIDKKSNLVSNESDSRSDQDTKKGKSSVRVVKEELFSPNGECLGGSQALKEPDTLAKEKVGRGVETKSDEENLSKEHRPSNAEEMGGLTCTVELRPSCPEESKSAKFQGATSQSTDAPEEDKMLHSTCADASEVEVASDCLPEQKDQAPPVASDSMVENGGNKDEKEAIDDNNENKDPVGTKDDVYIDKIKRAAVTAVSAAAVKAKILADQEEDQIRLLATLLIEKQLSKLETKLAFFTEMDSLVMKVRELLERSKQRLYQERAQIIAVRLGVSNSSSRPMSQPLPINRAATHFANSALRPPGNMNFQRIPMSRSMIASTHTSEMSVSANLVGNSVQSNPGNLNSVGKK